MRNAGQTAFWATFVFATIGIIVTLSEIPYIEEDLLFYVLGRMTVIVVLYPLAYVIRKSPYNFIPKLILIICITIYCCLGYRYVPMYVVAYTQLIFFFSFLYPTTKKEFILLSTLFYVGFVTNCYLAFDSLPYNRGEESYLDIFITPLGSNAIGFLVHKFFTAERNIKEHLTERFSSLGKMTSTIVHDLKGSLGTPLMMVEAIEESMKKGDQKSTIEGLAALKNNISSIGKIVTNLNQLSNVSNLENLHQTFLFSECLEDAKIILSKKLSHITLTYSGDCSLKGPKDLFTSIVLNLLINSLDEFSSEHISEGKITIKASPTSITFSDNGPGFQTDLIRKMRAGEIFSTKEMGSGLGLYLVRESLKAFQAKLEILNSATGGMVKITF